MIITKMHIHNAHVARRPFEQLTSALLISFSLSGCLTFPVKEGEIDWRYSTSSKTGCPNFDGEYFNEHGLFLALTGGVQHPHQGVQIRDHQELPRLPTHSTTKAPRRVVQIQQAGRLLGVRLMDAAGNVYSIASVPLDVPHIGCDDGALVIHRVGNHPVAEAAAGTVSYSETVVRKHADGGLKVEQWSAQRQRSNWTGKATGPVQDPMHVVLRFARSSP